MNSPSPPPIARKPLHGSNRLASICSNWSSGNSHGSRQTLCRSISRLDKAANKDSYTLYQASFQGNDGQTRFRCLFAVPDGQGPFPAMLALHGHGGNSELVFDKTSSVPRLCRSICSWWICCPGSVFSASPVLCHRCCGTSCDWWTFSIREGKWSTNGWAWQVFRWVANGRCGPRHVTRDSRWRWSAAGCAQPKGSSPSPTVSAGNCPAWST